MHADDHLKQQMPSPPRSRHVYIVRHSLLLLEHSPLYIRDLNSICRMADPKVGSMHDPVEQGDYPMQSSPYAYVLYPLHRKVQPSFARQNQSCIPDYFPIQAACHRQSKPDGTTHHPSHFVLYSDAM